MQSEATCTSGNAVPRFAEANESSTIQVANDRVAAAALVQMHGTDPVWMPAGEARRPTESRSFSHYSEHQSGPFRPLNSRSHEGAQICHPPAQYGTFTEPTYNWQHGPNSSNAQQQDATLQTTVTTLSRALANMQQQQTDLQQKQEHIAGGLISLITILQDMRSETRKSTMGDANNSRYISQPQTQSHRSSEP